MTDFTPDQITVLRLDYLRDEATVGPPAVYASAFNQWSKRRFVDDDTLNRMKARCENVMARELAGVYETERTRALEDGADDATAIARAEDVLIQAVYKLVLAEVLELQLRTVDFTSTIKDAELRKLMMEQWGAQIAAFRTFTTRRSSSMATGRVRR